MTSKTRDFTYSDEPEPHKSRTKKILKSHPEIRNLIGRNPYSFLILLSIVTFQIIIAALITDLPWWTAIIVAWLIGAFANHTLFVLIHEAAHNLIFKQRSLNYISGIIADLPNVVPSAVSFRSYHLKHHSFQGVYELDADLASRWEARLIGSSAIGKAIWEFLFPIFQALRPPRLKEIKFMNGWTVLNWLLVFGFDFIVIYFLGWTSFLYFVFSFAFSIGFHPLGARWIQEHFLTYPPQETYSYYGPLNVLALNVGYHNEHHDFPSIPWNNLRKVKSTAPEFYNNLHYHKSWVLLWLRFLFDPDLSLFSRKVRSNRGDSKL
ncbi:MAG: fatty acid desaturase [Melioribacteraceae bacterium]|nr:fatty acid desaturase [Melioribacteraceae bacterium]